MQEQQSAEEWLRERLADRGWQGSRDDALRRIETENLLPFRDADGHLILDVETGYVPGEGVIVESITKLEPIEESEEVDLDACPECGHDYVVAGSWSVFTCEHGHYVECHACGERLADSSTL